MGNVNDKYLKSYWIESTKGTNYPSLKEDIKVDVAIVGGGIVGITAGFLLSKQGVKIAVLEASKILQGATGFTTAKITSQHSLTYDKLINSMGVERAKQYADANEASISFIENTIKELNIDCDFEKMPAGVYTNEDKYVKDIEKELNVATMLGIKAKIVDNLPINIPMKSALIFENQAQFHPRKYLLPLAEKIIKTGNQIYENTEVFEVRPGNPIELVVTNGKKITVQKVIICSHFPCYDGMGLYLTRLRPERSYAVVVHIKEKFPKFMLINAENPTRSLRAQNDGEKELILVGGENHKVAHGDNFEEHYENLEKFAKDIFTVDDIAYRWSLQDYISVDNVPYIGKIMSSKENIYVATGFKKWGMTNGTAAARILTDEILGANNPWKEVFDPTRKFTAQAYGKLFAENFDVAKELIIGKIKSGEDGIDIKKDEGKIVEIEGHKYGAYRDEDGKLHIVNITCTHVGCELKWNDAEKSWDCPCHGSRFTYDGEILEGPATHRLNHYKEENNKIDWNL
ncbi:FAD-dependent oxidoreductase [Clostridium guangxiense]|uniref:FAD-dependent oxidoreductase n=1 Tax=Clostridium guangxiense TaxID=1662055 RepID=UPI001E5D5A6F|nr:FAD-dependent oxidoreductase [Clostridium guangxiense]MCD2348527.1 FAD-dependent oxidoreductase [Clostridium guangxiense]